MDALVDVFQALGDRTRWRILSLVSGRALCVCEIAEVLNMPQSTISSHLQVIRKAGLLESERCEKWIYYRLGGPFKAILQSMAEDFGATAATDATLAKDARRMAKRVARRAETCCPGPKKLASAGASAKLQTSTLKIQARIKAPLERSSGPEPVERQM